MPKVFNKRYTLRPAPIICIIAAGIFFGCSNDSPKPTPTVFVAGFEVKNNIQIATFWRNGLATSLTDGTKNAIATSITILGEDIYVAGSEDSIAKYWKNGTPVILDHKSKYSIANSIAVTNKSFDAVGVAIGTTVFVGGVDGTVGRLWINGGGNALFFQTRESAVTCVVAGEFGFYISIVDGSFAEYESGTYMATHPLASGYPFVFEVYSPLNDFSFEARANSIAPAGNDLYVAGSENNGNFWIAKYWKNLEPVVLTDGTQNAFANSICITNGSVYVAGNENGTSKYWKNGTAMSLSDGSQNADATSISVSGSDVYVAGFDGNVAKYWKNGVAVNLTDGSNPAKAKSIFVAR